MDALIDYWQELALREQVLLLLLAGSVSLWAVFNFAWDPLNAQRHKAQLEKQTYLDHWVSLQQSAADLQVVREKEQNKPKERGESKINNEIQNAATRNGLKINRFQPSKDSTIRIWLKEVSFNSLARWMHEIEHSYNINVINTNIVNHTKPGLVNAQIQLQY